MDNKEMTHLLIQAKEEIRMLRRQLAVAEQKAQAFEVVSSIVGLLPKPTQGAGIDVVWELENAISDLTPKAEDVDASVFKPIPKPATRGRPRRA